MVIILPSFHAIHCSSVYEKIKIYLDTNLKTILKEQEESNNMTCYIKILLRKFNHLLLYKKYYLKNEIMFIKIIHFHLLYF